MAVVNRNSTQVANQVANPPVKNPVEGSGRIMQRIANVVSAADDSATSLFRFLRVPSNSRVTALQVTTAAAWTTAGAIDIGVHRIADDGGAAVDADFFATGLALTGAALTNSDQLNESGTNTMIKQCQPLWQALGMASDPKCELDITATVSTTFNGGSTLGILLKASFAVE